MSISRLSLSGSGVAGLSGAVDRHARALERVQRAASPGDEPPRDRVDLSDAARNLPDPGAAVADAATSAAEVEATAAAARAEDERFAALMFVVSHHGPGLS
jgi:hypothetical protein